MKEPIGWAIINFESKYAVVSEIFPNRHIAEEYLKENSFTNKHRLAVVEIFY